MIKKPIPIFFYLDEKQSSQQISATIHIEDNHTEMLDLSLLQRGKRIEVPSTAIVTARFVRTKDKILISDEVVCTIQENGNILIPIDNAAAHMLTGEIKIEVNIVDNNDVLTMQFPLIIRVNNSILAEAEVSPESEGTFPELLEETKRIATQALVTVEGATEALNNIDSKISAIAPDETLYDKNAYKDLNAPANSNHLLVFFGAASEPNISLNLPPLTTADFGKIFHFEISFKQANMSKVLLQENESGTISTYAEYTPITAGKTIEFDYTMTSNAVTSFRMRMYENAGAQEIDVKISIKDVSVEEFAYSKRQTNALLGAKADSSSTLEGYGITDAYTTEQVDDLLDIRTGTVKRELTVYDNDSIVSDELDEPFDNVRFYITGSDSGAQLNLKSGQKYTILVYCADVNLMSHNSIRLYHRLNGTVTLIETKTGAVTSEDPYVFEYTKPKDATSTNLNLRFNCATGVQEIGLKIFTTEYVKTDSEDGLPDYCETEIERVKKDVLETTELNDVVFGVYTDVHFGNLGKNANDDAQKWNAIKCMRRLADEALLDFVIQGGDLLTKNRYDNDMYILNRSQYEFNGCRAPLFTSKGDHDSNQTDRQLKKSEFFKRTAPYMPKAVRCSEYPNNYYFDLPEKKTRVVNIDTGTVEAGQGGKGADYKTWTVEVFFSWLLDEVLTDEIKNGWKIIFFSHAPCDYEWQLGFIEYKRRKAYESLRANSEDPGYTYDPEVPYNPSNSELPENGYDFTGDRAARGYLLILNDLFEAINNAGEFSTEKTAKHYSLSHDENSGVLTEATLTGQNIGPTVYGISGIYISNSVSPYIKTKDFAGWTSKVRMILSGHCHFDRLNNTTLVPDGDDFKRGTTSYAIAYTGSAAKSGLGTGKLEKYPPSDIGKSYCNCCFGNDASCDNPGESASNAAWSHIKNREYGEISEQLMDVWIVGDSYVKRVRFGAGAGDPLLCTNLTV